MVNTRKTHGKHTKLYKKHTEFTRCFSGSKNLNIWYWDIWVSINLSLIVKKINISQKHTFAHYPRRSFWPPKLEAKEIFNRRSFSEVAKVPLPLSRWLRLRTKTNCFCFCFCYFPHDSGYEPWSMNHDPPHISHLNNKAPKNHSPGLYKIYLRAAYIRWRQPVLRLML